MPDWHTHCTREGRETLQTGFLSRRGLVIASNRGPLVFQREEDGILKSQRVGGGLVTALTGLCQHTEATWIACAQTDADVTWREGKAALTENGHRIQV